STAFVLDVQICDPELIPSTWDSKRAKYDTPQINASVIKHLGHLGHTIERIEHHPIVVSYNGLLYSKSSRILRHFGCTAQDCDDLCVRALIGSIQTYDIYMRGTHTY
ncbi:MAG: hypothetical protein ACRDDF_10805, partial [Aeromonas sp.]